jgi:pimeloyl-ACP methyl ester carboxylesterase
MSRNATSCSRSIVCRLGLLLCCALSVFCMAARNAWADDPAGAAAKSEGPPKPETIPLETNDGLQMEATYFASPSENPKDAVPIIMLHGWKGSSADFAQLALDMQLLGHAVIVPDLRGHGKSTQIRMGTDLRSIDQTLMGKAGFEAMAAQDVEAVKKFLVERNNAGKLNIEKLCVVGADMGAVVAMNWAVRDWSAPKLLTGKQGQDVKALVLISPPLNFHGISVTGPLADQTLKTELSVFIIAGGDKGGKAFSDAQAVYKRLSALRPKPPTDPEEFHKRQDLFFDNLKTSMQGTKILDDRKLQAQVSADIGNFIKWRLVDQKFPWTLRKSALGD